MSYLHPGLLSCRKPDGPFEYSGTNLTKTLGLIAVHTAIDGRSVHSLGYITTPFKYSGNPFIFLISRSGNRKDRKSTRLNSSHVKISYAVFCLKKKKKNKQTN